MSEPLHTDYAAAERISDFAIQEQKNHFTKNPLITNIFNTVPTLILVLNRERQIIYCNNIISDYIGDAPIQSILGLRPGELLNCVHAFETDGGCGTTEFCRACGAVNSILNSQLGRADSQDCRIQTKNLEALDLKVYATPFNIDNYKYTIFAITDISDEKRRKSLEQIFYHDILNIAGGLKGLGEQLIDASPEEVIEFRDIIIQYTDNLIDEINAQREFTAAENGDLQVHNIQFDSYNLLKEIVNIFTHHECAIKKSIFIDHDSIDINMFSDKVLVRRVLGNLLKNALEASEKGGTVTIGASIPLPGSIQFWVHNKTYIPHNDRLQIFQRSFSTKGVGRGNGTYSIKLLTEKYLKGNVTFTSTPENGTTFFVSYPLYPI
jgi:hypothetical protein